MPQIDAAVARALADARTIDITTTGAKSGEPRRVEIWFHRIDGRFFITGTPGPRGWLANLLAHPAFTFHLKGSTRADLRARAVPVSDPEERRRVLEAPETAWYRDQGATVDELVQASPLVEVLFEELLS